MKAYIVEQDRLTENLRMLKEKAGDTAIYGVIKGDGYGLGLIPMAKALWDQGITRFAVTEVSEVRALRDAGFAQAEILMLRETGLPEELDALLSLDAIATVGCPETADAMEAVSAAAGKNFPCHVKIDTGMGHYGFLPEDPEGVIAVYRREGLDVRGIYTHFHSAFSSERDTRAQFAAFQSILSALEAAGIAPGIRHCCNSSAFLKYPEMHLDAVRLGSAVLGRLSFPSGLGLKPIGYCEAQVELLREIPKGHSVGYGAPFRVKRPTRIAVCSVGYFHGFGLEYPGEMFSLRDCLRSGFSLIKTFLTHRHVYVTVNGRPARVLGFIGMVQTVCDVTDIPCRVGDPIRVEIGPLKVRGMDVVFR